MTDPGRRLLGAALAVGGLLLVAAGAAAARGTTAGELRYGVSRADGEPGIAIHWVLCAGIAARTVDLEGYSGGSAPPSGVPVLWQIRSDAVAGAGTRVATYVVGRTPDGFYETVPWAGRLPDDLIVISGPPGDATAMDGMSFRLSELTRDRVLRGDYEAVLHDRFEKDGRASCGEAAVNAAGDIGLVLAGLGALLFAGRRRPIVALLGAMLVAVGVVGIPRTVGLPFASIPDGRQPASAFLPGAQTAPDGRRVLLELTPDVAPPRERDGLAVGRFFARGPYAIVVACDGPSVLVGELAGLPDGSTGGRQLIGCSTPEPVRGLVADVPDRSELVELDVHAFGSTGWRVLVVEGAGSVGPFEEP